MAVFSQEETIGSITTPISAVTVPVGIHANAWNNVAVAANGNSTISDLQYQTTVIVFGNSSAAVTLRLQASQDGVNFYTVVSLAVAIGNFGSTTSWGARYMRLQSSAASTITATIAGK